jgi:predicted GTPase
VGSILETYNAYPHIGALLPAMGYSREQIADLRETINRADCDLVLFATPIQLTRIMSINKPAIRVRYEYQDSGKPTLEEVMVTMLRERNIL